MGRDPDMLSDTIHPTCPYGCRRPSQSLSKFAKLNFMPRPTKASSNTGPDAPYVSYREAQEMLGLG